MLCPHQLAAVICFLLFISGNVHTNTGPVQFPCGICKRSVNKSHRAVMCDAYDLWYHIKCADISCSEYSQYSSLLDFNWLCALCLFDELLSSEIFSLDSDGHNESTASQQFEADVLGAIEHSQPCDSVWLIHHNVQGLLLKVIEVT